jgi:hypothetical protein
LESLTSRPGIREQNLPLADITRRNTLFPVLLMKATV